MGRATAASWDASYQELAGHLFGELPAATVARFLTTVEHVIARLGDLGPAPPGEPR